MKENKDVSTKLDMEKELTLQKSMEVLKSGASQPKLMLANKHSLKKFDRVKENLTYLLNQTGFEYTLNVKRSNTFPEKVTIVVETASLGVCANDFSVFREVINTIDSFDSISLVDGNVRYFFCINDMYFNALVGKKKK